ncbi:cytochrome protein [Hortaea werneckii]|nr:cytochrome protein [Hortaea werneckii]
MYSIILPVFFLGSTVTWFIGYHVYDYFRDVKGLRRYPDMDPLAPFTNLSFMFLAYQGFRSDHLNKLHKAGRPVLRIGPNSLSYGDPSAIRDIYGHNSNCTKDDQYAVTSGSHVHLADVVDKKEHGRKRKLLSSAYAVKNLEGWEFKVADKVQRLVFQIDAHKGEVFDLRPWAHYFTLDAIADIGLSASLGFLDKGNDEATAMRSDGTTFTANARECLYAGLDVAAELSWTYRWYKHLLFWSSRLVPRYRNMAKLSAGWDGIYLNLATERLARYRAGEELDDFFQALMHGKAGAPNNLEWGEILAEVSIMMNAGSATTAIAIANVMHKLALNPSCFEKLREEVDSVLDEDDNIAPYDKVKYLPYLRACLDESMRLNPPVSHNLPRATPEEGAMILGEWIPGNTTVSMSAYVAHRDPSIFPEPESFVPDRWLGEQGKELGPYNITFTAGARRCIGRNISYLEQTVLVATLVRKYDVRVADPNFKPVIRESMGMHFDRMPLIFSARTGAASR